MLLTITLCMHRPLDSGYWRLEHLHVRFPSGTDRPPTLVPVAHYISSEFSIPVPNIRACPVVYNVGINLSLG